MWIELQDEEDESKECGCELQSGERVGDWTERDCLRREGAKSRNQTIHTTRQGESEYHNNDHMSVHHTWLETEVHAKNE